MTSSHSKNSVLVSPLEKDEQTLEQTFQKTTLWGPFSITSVCRVQKRLGGRKAKTEEKNLRFQKYPDKYGRDPRCVRQ